MSERRPFASPLNPERYLFDINSRFPPTLCRVGAVYNLRRDLVAFEELDGAANQPTVSEKPMSVKAVVQTGGRWTMLVMNNMEEIGGSEELTDFYATFDGDGLLRHFDTYPVLGDPLRSLDRARERHDPLAVPGGYIMLPLDAEQPALPVGEWDPWSDFYATQEPDSPQ